MMRPEAFLDVLHESNDKVLKAMAKHMYDWDKLVHDKSCLELFLRCNVAVVFHEKDGQREVNAVSSDPALLEALDRMRVERNRNKVVRMIASSPKYAKILKSKRRDLVRTWDLISNKDVEIDMKSSWAIGRFIGTNVDDADVLAKAISDILERGKAA